MKITDFYRKQKYTFSFEFFPPKTPEQEIKLFELAARLKLLKPSFISVTYGALGTTRDNTLRIVNTIRKTYGMETAHHLTCVAQDRDEIENILYDIKASGIENIVALRGDPPKGETEFKPVANGFRYASELVQFIKAHSDFHDSFSLAVAGYPEGHVECPDKNLDLKHLKEKVERGADAVITQLFFDNRDFFNFVERAQKIGIKVPIVPGIMPVSNGAQITRFASMCGASIPKKIAQAIEKYGDDSQSVEAFGVEYATEQCDDLLRQGVPGIHFYTLNKSNVTESVYRNLDLLDSRSSL